MPTVTVRWDDFESAFIIGSPDARYFLNLDNGEVEYTSHMDGETVKTRVLGKVERGNYLEVTRPGFEDAVAEVDSFIATRDADTQARLRQGMADHKSPFLGFNRAMGADKDLRRDWAAHRQTGISRRLLEFCRTNDLVIDHDRFRALAE